jgi:DNA-directed RNA polymerase specialized sigma24 family protein
VLLLVGVAGFDHAEAAHILGVPRGTVSWRLSVARTRFRKALG